MLKLHGVVVEELEKSASNKGSSDKETLGNNGQSCEVNST